MVSMSSQIIFPDQDWLNYFSPGSTDCPLTKRTSQTVHEARIVHLCHEKVDLTFKANIEYSVDSCHLTEYLGHKTVLNHQQIVNKNCIMAPSSNSTFSHFDAKYHR